MRVVGLGSVAIGVVGRWFWAGVLWALVEALRHFMELFQDPRSDGMNDAWRSDLAYESPLFSFCMAFLDVCIGVTDVHGMLHVSLCSVIRVEAFCVGCGERASPDLEAGRVHI